MRLIADLPDYIVSFNPRSSWLQRQPEKTNSSAKPFDRNKDLRSSDGLGHFAFLAADYREENEFSFLNPQIAEIHTDFLRRVLFSVICEDLRKSVDNPSGRDGLGCLISLRRSRFRFQRFRFAIPRRRIGD
jgi:hypothetical protein